jgi:hypothetical protein
MLGLLIAFIILPALFIWGSTILGGKVGGLVYDIFFRRKDRNEYMLEKLKRSK